MKPPANKTPHRAGRYWHTRTRHLGVDQVLDDAIVRNWTVLRELDPDTRLVPPDHELRGTYLIEYVFRVERWDEPRIGGQDVWVQTQLGRRPARPEDERAWRRAGSPRSWAIESGELTDRAGTTVFGTMVRLMDAEEAEPVQDPTTPNRTDRINWLAGRYVTVRDLAELPTDPDALKAEFMSRYTGEGSEGGPATAVALPAPDIASGAYEDRLLIDPATGVGLASEIYVVESGVDRPWASPGLRLSWTAVEAAHWTDERPEPAPPDDRD